MPELATYSAGDPLRSASSSRPRALALSDRQSSQLAAVILWLLRPWSLDPQQQHDEFLGLGKGQGDVGSGGKAFWTGTLGFVFLCLGWCFLGFLCGK